jgi:GDPmannose 4,6-dehydratase
MDHTLQDRHEGGVDMTLHYGDLTDSSNLTRVIHDVKPESSRAVCAVAFSDVCSFNNLYS